MPKRKRIRPHLASASFNESLLDRLVADSMRIIKQMSEEMEKEGYVIITEKGEAKVNPKHAVMARERGFVVSAWSKKFRDEKRKGDAPENHFDEVDLS